MARGSSGTCITIVIDLHDDQYAELVVEVDDPAAAVKLIQNAL